MAATVFVCLGDAVLDDNGGFTPQHLAAVLAIAATQRPTVADKAASALAFIHGLKACIPTATSYLDAQIRFAAGTIVTVAPHLVCHLLPVEPGYMKGARKVGDRTYDHKVAGSTLTKLDLMLYVNVCREDWPVTLIGSFHCSGIPVGPAAALTVDTLLTTREASLFCSSLAAAGDNDG